VSSREEYHAIADRRVRLGLVLAEIGEKNNSRMRSSTLGG
jgi:trigger factor